MKIKILTMALAAISFLSSCDKCKKADCQNEATCEKKVGDCVCTDYFEGDKCETEVRKAFFDKFTGTVKTTFFGTSSEEPMSLICSSYSSAQNFMLEDDDVKIYCQLTSKTAFKITGDSDDEVNWSGTGTISKSSLSISGNATIVEYSMAIPFTVTASK